MHGLVSKIRKLKDHQLVSQFASPENHLAFVLAAVNRLTNRTTAQNETLSVTITTCSSNTTRPACW